MALGAMPRSVGSPNMSPLISSWPLKASYSSIKTHTNKYIMKQLQTTVWGGAAIADTCISKIAPAKTLLAILQIEFFFVVSGHLQGFHGKVTVFALHFSSCAIKGL